MFVCDKVSLLPAIKLSYEEFLSDLRYVDLGEEPLLYCKQNDSEDMLERYVSIVHC